VDVLARADSDLWRGSCISRRQVLNRGAGPAGVPAHIVALHPVAPRELRGVEMKHALAVAAIAIICAAGHPNATSVDTPPAGRGPSVALMPGAAQNTANAWNGRWEGTTVSGNQLVLQLQVQGQRVTGRLTVGKQAADITNGKVAGDTFALTTGPIDGHNVDAKGRRVGDEIELTIEGAKKPLTLTRMK
jgi:hypothetical protein